MRALIALLAVACGGAPNPPNPPKPAPRPAVVLARALADDLAGLAALARRHAAACTALVAELEPQVARMQQHAREVEVMMRDPVQAQELKRELAGNAEQARARTDQIARDLGAAYLGCPDEDSKRRFEKAIAGMPTFE